MKKRFSAFLLLFSFAALFACTESGINSAPIVVERVVLNKVITSILVGGTETLSAVVTPTEAENKAVVWSSSDAAVATVSDAGVVAAVAAGTATVTATTVDGGHKAECVVTVSASAVAVTGVSLDETTATVVVGYSSALVATVAPAAATNKTVLWTSSDESIATVSADGVVTGVAAGAVAITVATQDGSKTAACWVTVEAAVELRQNRSDRGCGLLVYPCGFGSSC